MFYSQFILAKKGPLGTIWIAAHLERKLRKNQVADTDIGVSVDSILFPDAPIALRLSSHLLLGVVRIYSKKVNYLFNDCSEALIKIKHAFRSTAVDLPPEESTAPYHSITLPENFDLDNFELPDSAFLDGNFVDHHVSAREQITLQDTRNDTAFPTSKFGLDERFGDEDPSQIGLELDEELFIEKKVSPKHDEDSMSSKVSGSHHGETSVPSTSVAVDVQFGCNEEKYNEIPNELSELLSNNYDKNFFSGTEDLRRDANSSHRHGYTIQTPDLNETIQPEGPTALSPYIPFSPNDVQTPCLVEPAQEPSTPALFEVVPSHFQEVPALSRQDKDESHVELGRPGTCTSPSPEVECSDAGNKTIHASAELDHKFGEDTQRLPLQSALISPMPESVTPTYSNRNSTTDNVSLVSEAECQQIALVGSEINNVSTTDHRIDNEEAIEPSAFSHEAMTLTSPPKLAAHFGAEPATTSICTQSMDVSGDIFAVEQTPFKGSTEPTETFNLNRVKDGDSFRSTSVVGSDFLIRSCGSNLHLPSSSFLQPAPLEAELATSNIHTDNFDVSGVNLDLKRTCRNEPTETSNLGRGEDNDSCLITSVVGSDFLSRSPVSNLHPPSSIFVDGALGEASELSLRDYCFSQKTPTREEVQQISRSSFEVQGEDLRYSNGRFINLEGQHMSGYTPSDFKYGARKPNELSMNVLSKVSHFDNEKYTSSSEFLEPEKMLAPNFVVDFPSYQVLQATTDKGSTQSDGIFDTNGSQFSRKRRLMDSTILQTSTSAELSVLPRSKRSTDYIPSDNDVLASILDERTTPWLKTSSIPSLSKVSSQKRPRPMSRVGMPRRRKVLVDDAMVLHADAIRQQLTNTEDIRRMRKKAPCTRPEIWKIYIDAIEDDAFDRSILTGLSVELNSLCNLKNDAQKDPSSQTEELNSQVKTSGDKGSSRALSIKEMADKEMNERMLSFQSTFNINNGPSNITASASVQTREADVQINLYNQLQKLPVQPQVRPFRNDQASVIGSSGVLENPNELGDKEMNERILPFHSIPNRNDAPSNITMSAALQTLEVGAQSDLYDHLRKLPVHSPVGPFNHNQASAIGSSTVSQLRNEINDKEMNERILSVHGKDGPSSTRTSNTVQTHEVSAQYDLYDQLQKLSVQPQVEHSNHQASVICAMQADTDNFSTIIQKTTIPEIGRSISSVETRSIVQADEYNTEAKTSKGIESSMLLEFSNEMGDKEMNQRISSVPNIVNNNAGSSNITASDTEQIHEAGAHCDLYGQLNKLSVQPQVGPFGNDEVSMVCAMHPDAGTHPNSIIQETHITEIDRSVSSVEKYADKSINLPEEYNSQVKAPEGTGASRFLEFPKEIGDKEMNERIVSAPVIDSITSATVHSNVDSAQCDRQDQLENPPVQFELWPFSNDQGSLTCVTQPYAETQANSAILETPIHEIDKSLSSVEELTDKSINLSERSLHNNAYKPLNTHNDGSSYGESATLVRIDGDIEVEALTSESLVRTENICTAEGPVNMKEITDTFVVAKHSAVVVGTGGSVEALRDEGMPVVGTGGSVEALRDEGRPVSNVTSAEQNITFFPRSVDPDPSAMDKNNGMQDCNLEGGMDVDMPLDVGAVRNTSDFCSAIDDNYPGFLNEDDDDDDNAGFNEAGEDEPNPEDAQSLENSGWSARTRGVARYLKNLFDEETGQGRKSIAVNRLLAGKTRKEASRMFFETLVLKTRDYIQVEQEKPFESISIMPRIKLLKSEF